MANAVLTVKLMPSSPDVDVEALKPAVQEKVTAFTGREDEVRFELQPVAFGLKALQAMFLMDEEIGSTDELEAELGKLKGIQSVSVTDMRRALG